MDDLCNLLISCKIDKPVLYDMMIFDFASLSEQYYSNVDCYTFEVNPKFEYATDSDINELLIYIQKNNCEEILIKMIRERYGLNVFIEMYIIQSMIDYYLECLITI